MSSCIGLDASRRRRLLAAAGVWARAKYLMALKTPYLAGLLAATSDIKGVTGTIGFDEKGDIKNCALTMHSYKGGKMVDLAVIR